MRPGYTTGPSSLENGPYVYPAEVFDSHLRGD